MHQLRTGRPGAGGAASHPDTQSSGTPLGVGMCADKGLPFAEVFAQQFHVGARGGAPLPGFTVTSFGELQVQSGPDLAVTEAQFDAGEGQIVFLGIGVDAEGRVVTSKVLQRDISALTSLEDVARYVTCCAGRYVAFLRQGADLRLYLDPLGSLGAVYDPQTGVVASTLNLVLSREVIPNTSFPLTELAQAGKGRFAFGHTADDVVKRVLPNHYLDLGEFGLVRHWAGEDDIVEPGEEQQKLILQKISHRLELIIGALVAHGDPALLPLSGGVDSRVLLASSRGVFGKVRMFSHATNMVTRKDVRIARRLCELLGQELTAIDAGRNLAYRITDPDQVDALAQAWRIATDLPSPSHAQHEVVQAYPKGGLLLRGNGTDFLKAVLWRRAVSEYTDNQPHSIEEGLRMMMLGDKSVIENEALQAAYEDWYSAFDGVAAKRPYDFMFAEQFLSHGQGNMFYGFTNNFYICPFNDRALLAMATSLPPDRRRALDYVQALVAWRAPEIATMHFTRKSANQFVKAKRQAQVPVMQVA